jgi:PKHD-type hydroxylase
MLVHIPDLLNEAELATCRDRLGGAEWLDGRITAGPQAARAKRNRQLAETSAEARALGPMIVGALERNSLFLSAALPRQVFPPLFNRYAAGMDFGNHVDNAIRTIPGTPHRLRTDISATVFLSDPESYDGGELVIEDSYGLHRAKLPAGDLVLYPATSLHRVTPVTRGERLAAFFWVQSLVKDDGERSLLFELDTAIRQLGHRLPEDPALVSLTGCYHNLLRRWVEM